jgi:hypothetical protein
MKIVTSIALVVAVLLGILWNINRHIVWQYDTTNLIWSDDHAYLFVSRRNEGWSGNLLDLAWEFAKGAFYVSGRISNRTWWLEVTEFTAEGVKVRTLVPSSGAITPIVSGGHIYAMYEGAFSEWDNGAFRAVPPELTAGIRQSTHGGEFTDVEGWSSLYDIDNRTEGERSYPLRLRADTIEIIVNQRTDRRTISAKFPGKPPEVLLDLPTGDAWVDAPTYARVLSPPAAR